MPRVAWHLRKGALDDWATVPDYGLLAVAAWFAGAVRLVTTPQRRRGDTRPPRSDLAWRIVRRALRALAFAPALAAGLAIRSEYVPAYDHAAYARAGVMHAATALGTLVALGSLFGGPEQRVPEYVNRTVGAFLDIGCGCGTGWVVCPVALALPVALAFRLMGLIRVSSRRR